MLAAEDGPLDEYSGDIPDDVMAVLKAEIQVKTKDLEEEKEKLQKECDEKDDQISELTQKNKTLESEVRNLYILLNILVRFSLMTV